MSGKLVFEVDADLHEAFKKAARKRNGSMKQVLESFLRAYVDGTVDLPGDSAPLLELTELLSLADLSAEQREVLTQFMEKPRMDGIISLLAALVIMWSKQENGGEATVSKTAIAGVDITTRQLLGKIAWKSFDRVFGKATDNLV